MAERRRRRALGACLDLQQQEGKLLAFLGERACGGRKPLAFGERLLECDQALACETHARFEILLFPHSGARGSVCIVGQAPELGRRRAYGDVARIRELQVQLGQEALRRLVPHTEALRGAAQRQQRVAAAAGELRLRLAAADEHLVELFGERRLFEAFEGRDARPASFGLDLEARPLGRCRLSGGRRVACCCFQSDRRRRVVATRRLQLGAQRRGQGCCRFPAQGDALAAAAQAVERGRRLLAGSGRVGELFLGAFPLGDERVDLPVERAPLLGRRGTTPFGLGAALCQALEVERRDRRLQAGDLDPELLGALGGGGLERERP